MADNTVQTKSNIIRISNMLNLTRQEFNMIEKHIFLVTLLHIKEKQGFNINWDNSLENVEIKFLATELKETNRERIKEALDKITSRKIHFDNSTKNDDYFGYVVPFSYASYRATNGTESKITIHLNGACKKLFFELANGYTSTDLKAILNLKSTYSIRMYELMSQFSNQGKWTIDLAELKNLLGIDLIKYKSFTQFENKVLVYSQKELWEHCGIYFEWDIASKERKKITALKFSIRKKETQEKIDLHEEVIATQNFVRNLSSSEIANKFTTVSQKYQLSSEQYNYILSDTTIFNEFIRIDLIIEDMIEKGKPPRDRTKYLAKSLGLDKVKFNTSKKKEKSANLF